MFASLRWKMQTMHALSTRYAHWNELASFPGHSYLELGCIPSTTHTHTHTCAHTHTHSHLVPSPDHLSSSTLLCAHTSTVSLEGSNITHTVTPDPHPRPHSQMSFSVDNLQTTSSIDVSTIANLSLVNRPLWICYCLLELTQAILNTIVPNNKIF